MSHGPVDDGGRRERRRDRRDDRYDERPGDGRSGRPRARHATHGEHDLQTPPQPLGQRAPVPAPSPDPFPAAAFPPVQAPPTAYPASAPQVRQPAQVPQPQVPQTQVPQTQVPQTQVPQPPQAWRDVRGPGGQPGAGPVGPLGAVEEPFVPPTPAGHPPTTRFALQPVAPPRLSGQVPAAPAQPSVQLPVVAPPAQGRVGSGQYATRSGDSFTTGYAPQAAGVPGLFSPPVRPEVVAPYEPPGEPARYDGYVRYDEPARPDVRHAAPAADPYADRYAAPAADPYADRRRPAPAAEPYADPYADRYSDPYVDHRQAAGAEPYGSRYPASSDDRYPEPLAARYGAPDVEPYGDVASGRDAVPPLLASQQAVLEDAPLTRAERRRREEAPSHRTRRKGSASSTVLGAVLEVVVVVVLALGLALVVKTFLVQAFFIPSESMQNTLLVGDRVLVSKLTPGPFDLHRGDVVVFKDPGGWLRPQPAPEEGAVRKAVKETLTFVGLLPQDSGEHLIKRVIGLPGDTVVCCDANGKITVNGTPVDEPYLQPGVPPSTMRFTAVVPQGRLWVMGDNRPFSEDSRYHTQLEGGGTVPVENVVGKAFVIVWPFSRAGGLGIPDSVFADVRDRSTASGGP